MEVELDIQKNVHENQSQLLVAQTFDLLVKL